MLGAVQVLCDSVSAVARTPHGTAVNAQRTHAQVLSLVACARACPPPCCLDCHVWRCAAWHCMNQRPHQLYADTVPRTAEK